MLNLSILNKKTDSSETNNLLFYFVTASLGGTINSGGLKRKTPANQNPFTPAPILKDCQIVWEDGFEGTTLNPSKWKYRNEGKPLVNMQRIQKITLNWMAREGCIR